MVPEAVASQAAGSFEPRVGSARQCAQNASRPVAGASRRGARAARQVAGASTRVACVSMLPAGLLLPLLLLMLLLGLPWGTSRAQTPERPGERWLRSPAATLQATQDRQAEMQQIQAGEMAFEGAVDPDTYRLAPGDRLMLSIWGAANEVVPLIVAADGGLVVPSVGVLPVDGLTLSAAAGALRERARSLYPGADITLTLVRPALLRIAITGLVAAPGTYEIPAGYRLGDLIELAGGLRGSADARRIRVEHRDGTASTCDQLAWHVDGDAGGNPALAAGDRIFVSPLAGAYRVRGLLPDVTEEAPNRSSVVDRPFDSRSRLIAAREGDVLAFVLRAAGGLGPEFCAAGVWVERGAVQDPAGRGPGAGASLSAGASASAGASERRWVALTEAGGFAMQPGDVVEIPFCGEWVAVGGSVMRPGLYPYLPGETVAHYVYAAGGPSQIGRTGSWKMRGPWDPHERGAAAADTVAPGAMIRVPERRSYTISSLLTPVATAAAVVVSIVALAGR
jgi:protein involved in polysaccharide export with SLBB domain